MPPGRLPGRGRAQVRGPAWARVATELGDSRWSPRPLSGEAGNMPGLPWSRVWPQYNEAFVSAVPAPTSLGNPTPPSSCAPSSFLPGPGGGKGTVCTWMDPMVSWEARAGHSSGTEGEVAFPLLGRDLAGGGPSWEGKSHPGPKGATSPGSYSEVWAALSRPPSPSGPQRGGRLPWHMSPCRHAAMPPACSLGVLRP